MACETEPYRQIKPEIHISDEFPYEVTYDGERSVFTRVRWSAMSDDGEEVLQIVFEGKLSPHEVMQRLQQMGHHENLDLPESNTDYERIISQLQPTHSDPSAFCGEVFDD